MKRAILMSVTGLAAAFAVLAAGYLATDPQRAIADEAPKAAASAGALDRKEVEMIVRDYLLKNPEIMLEVQQALEAKQKEEQRVANLEVIESAKDEIFNAAYDGLVGNPDGKTTIVEFYDYNCGFCKRAITDMHELTAADPNLRFVLKEFPILGPDSQKAHTVSQAFHRLMPDKYAEFHDQLLGGHGRATEESAIKLAVSLGADEAKLREEMKNPEIQDVFAHSYELAGKLEITGTPSYVVGNEVIFGALGKDVLSEKIAEARNCIASAAC